MGNIGLKGLITASGQKKKSKPSSKKSSYSSNKPSSGSKGGGGSRISKAIRSLVGRAGGKTRRKSRRR